MRQRRQKLVLASIRFAQRFLKSDPLRDIRAGAKPAQDLALFVPDGKGER
jgi:hypothetical protein